MPIKPAAFLLCLLSFFSAAAQTTESAAQAPESCPVTKPPQPAFVPPLPFPADPAPEGTSKPEERAFWYGTSHLWTFIRRNPSKMTQTTGYNPRSRRDHASLREKLFWWSEGLDWLAKQSDQLTVTGKRLDGPAPPLMTDGPG